MTVGVGTDEVPVTVANHVATVTWNRPERRNAVTDARFTRRPPRGANPTAGVGAAGRRADAASVETRLVQLGSMTLAHESWRARTPLSGTQSAHE